VLFAKNVVTLHAKRAKLGGASAIGASSIAFGLHEFCGQSPLKATTENSQKQVSLWKQ
jgi:hypothetical protein